MVRFKSWRDAYIFLKKYGNFSCLNCKYSNHNLDTDKEHSDSEYVHLFCTDALAMVRLDWSFVCSNWVHEDTGATAEDVKECYSWNLPDEVIDIIENSEKRWSIDEIEELINECEEVIK